MRGDGYKRFSKYKDTRVKRNMFDFLFDWLVKGLFVAVLISINFLVFASSSNYSLFAEGYNVVPQILCPIIVIFAVSICFMFLISFSELLEDIFLSLVAASFSYAIINQYIMISPDSFLYSMFYNTFSPEFAQNFVTGSDFIVAIIVFIFTFVVLMFTNKIAIFFATFLLFILFGGIFADEYINQRNKNEFVTVYENEKKDELKTGNRFIYIMLPNATSYGYLSEMSGKNVAQKEFEKTKDIMLGFYAKNNFTMYANAYVEEIDPFMNIVDQFNILNNKPKKEAVLDNVMIDGYLKFKNRNEKYVYLEDNELFNNFKHANYKINVYQSHGIELCHTNNELVADKCVEKFSRPFSFNDMTISESQKANLLILQWIESTALFTNLSWAYDLASSFTDPNKLGLIGVPYSNLYVINSIKTLDVVYDDLMKDNGNVTYFVLIDAPGEMYVYDEYCKIKKNSDWLSKIDLPWVKPSNPYYKKKAYLEQMNCVYGKLQEFLDKLELSGLDKDTVVVVQGISGVNDKTDENDFISKMKSQKFVTMAIKDPKNETPKIKYDFCPISSFLSSYLYNKKVCNQSFLEHVGDAMKFEIKNSLAKNIINGKEIEDSKKAFENWHISWLRQDDKYIEHIQKMAKHEDMKKIKKEIEAKKAKFKKTMSGDEDAISKADEEKEKAKIAEEIKYETQVNMGESPDILFDKPKQNQVPVKKH